MKKYYAGLFLLAALCACTQPPAELVDRGKTFYGRDTAYNEGEGDNTHISIESNGMQESASVGNVGVSDLKPVSSRALEAPGGQVASSDLAPIGSSPVEQSQLGAAADTGDKKNFIWPVDGGRVISRYSKTNDGISIAASEGKPIHAAAGGTVVYAGNELQDYGNMIIIRHAGGYMTAYAHAQRLAAHKNDQVKQGDVIAYVGKTGDVKQAQLHFGMRSGKQSVDPEQYLPKSYAGL
jgi:murein DD-endopeptidase MepM/ murein hydrolase activator NlpD